VGREKGCIWSLEEDDWAGRGQQYIPGIAFLVTRKKRGFLSW
jgi:hypothetical protein